MQTPSISRCRENGIFSQRTQTTTYASGSRDQERTPGDCRQLDFIVKQSSASPRVKWIVSSRNWPHIEKKFKTAAQGVWLRLELNENSISAAVTSYIQAKVDQLAGENKYDDDTRDTVQHYLLSNANGTFLWVALVYQELAKISRISRQRIQERLAAFPPGLDCLYSRMMDHILSSDDAELCKRILAVVSLVYRPVTLDELVSLIDMLDDDDDVSVDDEALPKIIGLCGSFLTLRERTIFFVHQSAKDFLVDKRKGYGEIYPSGIEYVHLTVFSRSLQVMSERLKRNIYSQDKLGIFVDQVKQPDPDPLSPARYSCVHWIDHLLDCDPARNATSNLQDGGLIDKFLRQKFLYWLEALSLCKSMSKGVHAMAKLEAVIQGIADAPALHELVRDACRFILSHKWAIQNNPLQAYVSALVFSPTCSLIRGLFKKEEPDWITIKPGIGDQWSACLQTLEGHRGSVRSVAFSHDSTRLASASHDSTVKIWDTSSGECLQTLEGHRDWVYSVAFSHDSTRLASASNDSTVEIWDTSGGECLQTLEGHRGSVRSVAFSHDSTRLASASHDSTVKIWDTSSGECLQTLEGHRGSVWSVAFSHDSTRLASAAIDSTVKIWDTSGGECLQTLEGHRGSVNSVAFSHDSTRLASAAFDSTVKIWDTSSGECLQTLEGHRGSVYSVAFSHDSTRLASAAFDSTVKIWDTSGGECLQTLEVGRLLNRISFDITDSYLHTEIGTIDISAQSGSNTLPTISEPLNPKYQSLALSSDSVWITCDSENLVWLPSEYRLSCSAVSEKMIGVGVGTGRVWICKV